jgi:hypothetical protein
MRERSTWNRTEVQKKAAQIKKADIYTMNQDHPQPAFDKYVTGDPSDFAEDVHSPNEWEQEYSGDEVKRDEIGMPEFRSDTFKHSEKTASKEVLLKKADLCVAVATLMLSGKKIASATAIEDQAVALMYVPDQELIATHARLAADQDDDGDEDDKGQQQSKQGGEVPPQFLEHMKKKEDDDGDKDEDKKDQGEKKQAQQQDQDQGQAEESEQEQSKQAKEDGDGGDQNAKANKNWPVSDKKAAQDMMAQMQQMQAQLQQMMQAMQQPQAPMAAQEHDLDQMLAQDSCGPMAEQDIEMDPFQMDDAMGEMGPEDEALKNLFASEDDQDQQVQEEQEQAAQEQQKQAKSVRTASTRTVGTRPTAGVSKLGGGSKTASASSVDNLSSLWQSAPDVRGAFGLK